LGQVAFSGTWPQTTPRVASRQVGLGSGRRRGPEQARQEKTVKVSFGIAKSPWDQTVGCS